MTREELRAKSEKGKEKTKAKKEASKEKKKHEEVERPKAVLEISREYVEYFFRHKADSTQREWIKQTTADLMSEHGDIEYFSKFKMEFAKEFLDDIIVERQVKLSMLETFFTIEDEEQKQEQGDADNDETANANT